MEPSAAARSRLMVPALSAGPAAAARPPDSALIFEAGWLHHVEGPSGPIVRLEAGTQSEIRYSSGRLDVGPEGLVTAFIRSEDGLVLPLKLKRGADGVSTGRFNVPDSGHRFEVWFTGEGPNGPLEDTNFSSYPFQIRSKPSLFNLEPHVEDAQKFARNNLKWMKEATIYGMAAKGIPASRYDEIAAQIQGSLRLEIRVQPDAAENIVREGRFRNATEVDGKDPEYLKKLAYNQKRMGLPPNTIYAAALHDDVPGVLEIADPWGREMSALGPIRFVIDPQRLVDRLTLTQVDSFASFDVRRGLSMFPVESFADIALNQKFSIPRRVGGGSSKYQEAQLARFDERTPPLTVDDVVCVIVPKDEAFDGLAERLSRSVEVRRS
jgi:hypothetical protein